MEDGEVNDNQSPKRRRASRKRKQHPITKLAQYQVLLLKNQENITDETVYRLCTIFGFSATVATMKVTAANDSGQTVLATVHHELAELYILQLKENKIPATLQAVQEKSESGEE